MRSVIDVKSAKARATIARNLYVTRKSVEFSRELDNCFEMNDGDEVARLLAERVKTDEKFRDAILFRHWWRAPLTVLSVLFGKDAKKMTSEEIDAAVKETRRRIHG